MNLASNCRYPLWIRNR